MNWGEKAAAETHDRTVALEVNADEQLIREDEIWSGGFLAGADWMRDQLRTSEAIERAARAIARLDPNEEWPNENIIDDEYRDECHETALAAITALLGEH